jgi:hypothetical protein
MGIPKSAVSPLFMAIKDLMNNPKQLSTVTSLFYDGIVCLFLFVVL